MWFELKTIWFHHCNASINCWLISLLPPPPNTHTYIIYFRQNGDVLPAHCRPIAKRSIGQLQAKPQCAKDRNGTVVIPEHMMRKSRCMMKQKMMTGRVHSNESDSNARRHSSRSFSISMKTNLSSNLPTKTAAFWKFFIKKKKCSSFLIGLYQEILPTR